MQVIIYNILTLSQNKVDILEFIIPPIKKQPICPQNNLATESYLKVLD